MIAVMGTGVCGENAPITREEIVAAPNCKVPSKALAMPAFNP